MILPDYWLRRPEMDFDHQTQSEFDQIFDRIKRSETITRIDYDIPAPKFQFLCYLAEQHGVAMHGTGETHIQLFEPRPSIDLSEFGGQTAVYAAGDGLWAMFFAILDRQHYPMATSNACIRLVDEVGVMSGPYYVFSISQYALAQQPWRKGMVYLLPGDTFMHQPSLSFDRYEVRVPQLASLVPVKPYAYLEVTPQDFPFLMDIRGIDDSRLAEYGQAMQTGEPWPE